LNIVEFIFKNNFKSEFTELISDEQYIINSIAREFSKAIIVIYDNFGNVIKTFEIRDRGEGLLHVFAEKLSNEIYKYALIVVVIRINSKQTVCNIQKKAC
jgi:hypothetical protein